MMEQRIKYKNSDSFWKEFPVRTLKKELVYDLLQKITYSVTDLNNLYSRKNEFKEKDIIYLITLVCWISYPVYKIVSNVDKTLLEEYVFKKDNELNEAYKYLCALRSFAIAHPLNTDRHVDYGFDGSKICVDIRLPEVVKSIIDAEEAKLLTVSGIEDNKEKRIGDYYLYIYTNEDDYKSGQFIACFIEDLYDVAQLYIDKLCSLETFLYKSDGVHDE